jgi:hypothetical protein
MMKGSMFADAIAFVTNARVLNRLNTSAAADPIK